MTAPAAYAGTNSGCEPGIGEAAVTATTTAWWPLLLAERERVDVRDVGCSGDATNLCPRTELLYGIYPAGTELTIEQR
jgi:hypothetical protein